MVQEIVSWCDACDGERPERGKPIVLQVSGAGQKVLDLCAVHEDELLGPIRELISKWGRSVQQAPKAAVRTIQKTPTHNPDLFTSASGQSTYRNAPRGGADKFRPWECFVCETAFASSKSLENHYDVAHGRVVQGLAGIYGDTCPMCGKNGFGSLGTHGRRKHDAESVGALFRDAVMVEGDPHGVVAARREALGG